MAWEWFKFVRISMFVFICSFKVFSDISVSTDWLNDWFIGITVWDFNHQSISISHNHRPKRILMERAQCDLHLCLFVLVLYFSLRHWSVPYCSGYPFSSTLTDTSVPCAIFSLSSLSRSLSVSVSDDSVALCCCQKQSAGGSGRKQTPAGCVTHRWTEVD